MWNCDSCAKRFKYESELKRHKKSHVPQFQCEQCSKKFSYVSALKRHQKQHKRTGTVKCSKCDRNFRDDTLLKRHMDYAHKGTYKCKTCKSKFNSELALSTHLKTHKPKTERRYVCSFVGCRKTFNFSHHLKHHEFTHVDVKPYHCSVCKKGFIQLHYLKSHEKIHTPDDWFDCLVSGCEKRFATEYARRRHLSSHKNVLRSKEVDISAVIPLQEDTDNPPDLTTSDIIKVHNINDFKDIPSILSKDNNVDEKIVNGNPNNYQQIENLDTVGPIVGNCKEVLGHCITNEDSCLCAQITTTVDNDELSDVLTSLESPHQTKIKPNVFKENMHLNNNICEDCECASTCSLKYTNKACGISKFMHSSKENDPDIEYRIDGTIKIKETFEPDIERLLNVNRETKFLRNNNTIVPYNSCKEVLGNCIVSGNGSISEECLCAKMVLDDQQMTAEEIDEITPLPTNNALHLML